MNFDGDCTSIAAIKQNTNKENNGDKKKSMNLTAKMKGCKGKENKYYKNYYSSENH